MLTFANGLIKVLSIVFFAQGLYHQDQLLLLASIYLVIFRIGE